MGNELVKEFIEELRNDNGYAWILENGYEMKKDDLVRSIAELLHAIEIESFYPPSIYDTAAKELEEWYE